jgi:hypothetical protein
MADDELTVAGSWSQTASYYWSQSRRPLASLAFVLPLLVLYEGGVVILGPHAVRNGADVWLRRLLDGLGFGSYFLLPVITVGLLLGWHHVTHQRWRVSAPVLYAMFAECAVLALALLMAGRLQSVVTHEWLSPQGAVSAAISEAPDRGAVVGMVLGFAGAGVYEEVLFRLILLPPAWFCLSRLGAARAVRIVGVVGVTSLVFAAAHYLGPYGEYFDAFSFSFRFVAGAVFAMLFVYRGFGIAAGTHALYDIFVSLG